MSVFTFGTLPSLAVSPAGSANTKPDLDPPVFPHTQATPVFVSTVILIPTQLSRFEPR